jgi:hypothetical protein
MTFFLAAKQLSPWIWLLLATLASIGVLAMVSPRHFSSMATRGSNWVDTNKLLEVLDKRIDIDESVKPFSRVLGFAVVASAVLIGALLMR